MKKQMILGLALSIPLFANTQAPKPLTEAQVRELLDVMKTSNSLIDKESKLVGDRCQNQRTREAAVKKAIENFNGKIKELNKELEEAEEARKPLADQLEKDQKERGKVLALIKSLELQLKEFGKPDAQRKALLEQRAIKQKELGAVLKQRKEGQAAFDKWEASGDNERLLNEALLALKEANGDMSKLSKLQIALIGKLNAFRKEDERLFNSSDEIASELAKIEKDLKALDDQSQKSRAELEKQLKEAKEKLAGLEAAIAKVKPVVGKWDDRIVVLKGAIQRLGNVKMVPISKYCEAHK